MQIDAWVEREFDRIGSFYQEWITKNMSDADRLMLDQSPEEWAKLASQHKPTIEAEAPIPFLELDLVDYLMCSDPISWDEFSASLCQIELEDEK